MRHILLLVLLACPTVAAMNADDKVKLAEPKEGWGSYLRVNLTKKLRKHSAQEKKCYHFQVGEESSKERIAIKFIRHETNKETREFAAADHAADDLGHHPADGTPHTAADPRAGHRWL